LYTTCSENQGYNILRSGFEKKILVLITESDHSDELLVFLQKMMGACQFQEQDYSVVLSKNSEFDASVFQTYPAETVLLFGIQLQNDFFSAQKSKYQPFRFHSIKWLLSEPLHVIVSDAQKKSLLWTNGLKPLFGI
jgi:hypothetical protein